VTCSYCNSELPAGAMFCGECGRAVVAESAVKPAHTGTARPRRRASAPGGSPSLVREPVVMEAARDTKSSKSAQRGRAVTASAQRKAEVAPPVELAAPAEHKASTDRKTPPERKAQASPQAAPAPAAAPVAAPTPAPVAESAPPAAEDPSSRAKSPEVVDLVTRCEQCGSELGADDIFCGECGYVTRSASANFSRPRDTAIIQAVQLERDAVASAASIAHAEPPADPEPHWGLGDSEDELEDVEATRIVAQRRTGARFVLQFSTGESFTVYGSGLVGRNPHAEPAEYFDHVVRVLDPSRSVSKTHLEFGQESGSFWIKDRFSGNGSIIREPEGDPVRCQPDRRYRVVRGTRVDIGEQFFVVS
jgi:hypothetical protein